jgi:hypothetical protein
LSHGAPLDLHKKVEDLIVFLRGPKVIPGFRLAEMCGVETRILVRVVRRNPDRFPEEFMLQLSAAERDSLRSHFMTLGRGRGKRPKDLPCAFTEQGVAMLSSVLPSPRAVRMNFEIMRAFVRLRGPMMSTAELSTKINGLERKYDKPFAVVFEAIRRLMETPAPVNKVIGLLPEGQGR